MHVCEGTEKMSGRPPPHTLLHAERKATKWGERGGGLEWGKVKDNFHLKKPKYLFIVKFDNLILCNCRRRGKKTNLDSLEGDVLLAC